MNAPNGQPTDPAQLHAIQPPPDTDPQVAAATRILELYAGYQAASAALATLLAPYRISRTAILAAFALTRTSTNHQPRPVGYHQLARAQARQELSFRAAYLLRASQRIQHDLDTGKTVQEAVAREKAYKKAHDRARKQRQHAMRAVIRQAQRTGQLIGWYLDPRLNNEPECVAANGHNFDALQGTIIGYPGTVHTGCGCRPGPPHRGAGLVDDAVIAHVYYAPYRPLLKPA